MKINRERRILVIANEALSLSTSNGRTLRNFLLGWPKESVAQLFLHGGVPDPAVCGTYYCCTDSMALDAFLGRKTKHNPQNSMGTEQRSGKTSRSALTMLVRDLVWNSRRWATPGFWNWVDAFSPQIVVLQAGDCAFMLKLAEDLSKKYRAPLVIYNSEGYYFKQFDYFRAKGLAHWCYPLFIHLFRRQFRRTMHQASHTVYLCDSLRDAYEKEFSVPSEVLYTATELHPFEPKENTKSFSAAYLGNLGVGRHESLLEIGEILHSISEDAVLHIYGRAPNEDVKRKLESGVGVAYHGLVSYDTVKQVMEDSDLLVHAENFSAFYQEDLKYAFSTKIADSLACGRSFLLYAPEQLACSSYLMKNQAAYVAGDRESLRETLELLVAEPSVRNRYLERAAELVERNHRMERNAARFQEILKEVGRNHENSAGELRL